MSDNPEHGFNRGLVFVLGILIIVSGVFSVLAVNAPEDTDDGENDPWEPTPYNSYINPLFSGIIAEHFVEKQLEFGYRVPGTEEHRACRDFIRDCMLEFGYTVEYQEFSYNGTPGTNIIARRPVSALYDNPQSATDENENSEPVKTLILGAHYDTRPFIGSYPYDNSPIMGANDGASGVAVLLELARVMAVHPVNLNLEFVFFDFEDSGRFSYEYAQGALFYAQSLNETEKENILGAIVVDMVGDKELEIYYEKNSDIEMVEEIWKEADKLDYSEFHHSQKHNLIDDHIRLINVGIPSVLLIDFDYPYWHTLEDTFDKISGTSLEKVGRVVERYIYSVSNYQRQMAETEDVTVERGSQLTLSHETYHVNGDLTINGTLILENTLLIMNGEEGYEHLLRIGENGSLDIRNSIITSPNQAMKFESYGKLSVVNSTVEQLWGDTQSSPFIGGIQIFSPDFHIQDSVIRFSKTRGLFIKDVKAVRTPAIESTSILHNGEVGLYSQHSTIEIHDTFFEGNGHGGIGVVGGGIVLKESEIGYGVPEGSCTTGDCSGPKPTYGIEISGTDGNSLIMGTTFHEIEKGIVGRNMDFTGGSLTIDNVSMEGPHWGIELLSSSPTVKNSFFNDTGIAISFQNSNPTITGNLITNSRSAISSLGSSGNVTSNEIRNVEYNGISLESSEINVLNNSVSGAEGGVYVSHDRGSTIENNSLSHNIYGLNFRVQEDSINTEVITNDIYKNSWAIYCIGNSSRIAFDNNAYSVGGENNNHGILWEEREIILRFFNNTEDVSVNFTWNGEIVHRETVSKESRMTTANLTTSKKLLDGTELNYAMFKAEASSGSNTLYRDFNIFVISELIFEFP